MTARTLGLGSVRQEDPGDATITAPQKRLLNADIEPEPAEVTKHVAKTGQVRSPQLIEENDLTKILASNEVL